ncbi:WecB/TagA/CpsF family glycosyltransferase [Stenotrophomonas sp. CFBP8980]|uniref:WecB/TagA/CpsF family glycosyltransferase n=1 Tax=Stenotrophomonas sp. CFBP8980 TaxID=3096523 RepID=UPI002A6AF94D|nr:WecB/TagA/CpsF family glycosyltransferase [Stenotrophomonas sp. CFBP8980]MDY1034251.1 WecB/TagA/CpsF family glycosyltransferase [Stenotrophomonas sp. CFBP8980]
MNTEITRTLSELASPEVSTQWKDAALGKRDGWFVSFINPYSVRVASTSPSYLDSLRAIDEVLVDGSLLASLASRIRGKRINRRSFDGNSIAQLVFSFCEQHSLRVALVGAEKGIAERGARVICKSYPSLQIPVLRHGFFADSAEIEDFIPEIVAAGVNLVIVGMGAPHQESFLLRLRDGGFRGAAFTCGGYLDQLSQGEIEYYPKIIERLNLRAPYRLFKEPKRLSKRYLVDYSNFYRAAMRLLIRKRSANPKARGSENREAK